jgi:flagellar protein FliT
MNTPDLIQRVLDLTLKMEHAAQMDDWPGAARLARERNPLLMSIGKPRSPEERGSIERIQVLTVAINRQAEAARTELTAEYRATMNQASGAVAYQRGAGF